MQHPGAVEVIGELQNELGMLQQVRQWRGGGEWVGDCGGGEMLCGRVGGGSGGDGEPQNELGMLQQVRGRRVVEEWGGEWRGGGKMFVWREGEGKGVA